MGDAGREAGRIEVPPGGALLDPELGGHGADVLLDCVGDRTRADRHTPVCQLSQRIRDRFLEGFGVPHGRHPSGRPAAPTSDPSCFMLAEGGLAAEMPCSASGRQPPSGPIRSERSEPVPLEFLLRDAGVEQGLIDVWSDSGED
ncbi:hypothetical protein ACIGQE_18665 [Streptomyces sp. NPDC053429]|uniref:hypothetical protein n=1 Tax=Streptomyces sp. NPDC053429 TaxID=3365702 RepID=UPI0037D2966C